MNRLSCLGLVTMAMSACAKTAPAEPATEAAAAEVVEVVMVEAHESTVPVMAGVSSWMVKTPRLGVHVLTTGPDDGVPVVFVHGNVSSATFWEETMLALPEGHRGIAPDLRGYGDTEAKPVDASRGLDDMAEDVWAVVDTLGLGNVHLVGHSMGGGVVQKAILQRPGKVLSVTLVDPVSPFGYGGSKGPEGTMVFDDGAPTGVNPQFVELLKAKNTGLDDPMSPRNTFRAFYVKPPFVPAREDALIASMLTTRVGDTFYPGTSVPSENWPGAAPGDTGILAAFNRLHFDASGIVDIDPKPPILWIRGADDQIVSDTAMFDLAYLGKLGAVPGWPGDDVVPPQPMLAQTRAVLDAYQANGGVYTEVVIDDAAHSPFLEKPVAFNAALHPHLATP